MLGVWSDWDAGWWGRGEEPSVHCEGVASAHLALSTVLGRDLKPEEAELAGLLGELYSSEINAKVVLTLRGWSGDLLDGQAVRARSEVGSVQELHGWLRTEARRCFPVSEFAKDTAS